MTMTRRILLPCAMILALCSCAVGPDYKRPDAASLIPADWRWKPAEPMDEVPKGAWWKVFRDPALDDLESVAVEYNQTLRGAVARVDQARASARLSRSRFFPELTLDPSFKRERTSGNPPTPLPLDVPSARVSTYSVPLDAIYEVDLWGRVRRSFEAAEADARASVSDYRHVLLTLTADVAVNYFVVRFLDAEIAALRRTVELRHDTARILEERFMAGVVPEIDAERAKSEAAGAKADLSDAVRQRAETLHALALLCGRPAASFDLAEAPVAAAPAVVPAGLPSSLLERRPDIARAERSLAARTARIGVARAARFPSIRLTGQAGYLSAEAGSLFSSDSRVWSIGPGVSLPLFDAGRAAAGVGQAEALARESLAEYRQTVLAAVKEVEDSLAQIVLRGEQAAAQSEALASARRAAGLARARYEAGATDFLDLADAERAVLQHERRDARIAGERFVASVRLIKALGGGWEGAGQTQSAGEAR